MASDLKAFVEGLTEKVFGPSRRWTRARLMSSVEDRVAARFAADIRQLSSQLAAKSAELTECERKLAHVILERDEAYSILRSFQNVLYACWKNSLPSRRDE